MSGLFFGGRGCGIPSNTPDTVELQQDSVYRLCVFFDFLFPLSFPRGFIRMVFLPLCAKYAMVYQKKFR